MTLKVHPLGGVLELEDTGSSTIPYLGYVEVNLQFPGIQGYNEDITFLVILTMTYHKRVMVMVRSKIIDRVMGKMAKGEVMRATATWKQAHFSVIIYGSLQLPHTDSKGYGEVGKEVTPSPGSLTLQHPGNSAWMMSGGPVYTTQKITIFPLVYMATQVFQDTACESMCLLS